MMEKFKWRTPHCYGMSIEVRIKSALKGTAYKPNPSGDHIEEVDIPSNGLDIEDVREHELVEDVFEKENLDFHVYVSVEPEQRVYSV